MTTLFSRLVLQRRRWIYGLVATLVAGGIVMGTPSQSLAIPWGQLLLRGVQVLQLSSVSDQQEVSLGQKINQQLVSQEVTLYSDRTINDYVNQVGQRLVPESDRPSIPYVFQVVRDDDINAFATMGGYVYVTTGLLKATDNEAQLASVIGHEIGHIAARHALKQLRERTVTAGVLTAVGLDSSTAVNIGVELAINRPNSRDDEYEADEKGLATIERAGYAPSGMVAFMEKLLNQRSVPTFLSSHPATGDRIERLNSLIDPATANVGSGLDSVAYRNKMKGLP